MPNRIVRDAILSSERVSSLGWAEEVFYRRLMSIVDDYGRFEANYKLLRAKCYPLQTDDVSLIDIANWLDACCVAGLVAVYEVGGKRYLELDNFKQQQRSASKFPPQPSNDGGCYQMISEGEQGKSNGHLGVGEVGDVIGDEDGDGGAVGEIEPSRAVQIAVFLRASGIDGANASNPLLIEWAENAKVTDDLLATVIGMVRDRKPTRPGPRYIAPIIAQLLTPQANGPPGRMNAKDESRAAAAASIGLGAPSNDDKLTYIDGRIRQVD